MPDQARVGRGHSTFQGGRTKAFSWRIVCSRPSFADHQAKDDFQKSAPGNATSEYREQKAMGPSSDCLPDETRHDERRIRIASGEIAILSRTVCENSSTSYSRVS
jgi:hypothetical protein